MNFKRIAVAGLIALAAFTIACGTSSGNQEPPPAAVLPSTSASVHVADQPAPNPNVIDSDGTFIVGTEVAPGTWRAKVPADSFGCYWARLKNLDGDFTAIIANNNGLPGSAMTVTIKDSDKGFETRGCGKWSKS